MDKIRVAIADDHSLFRNLISEFLSEHNRISKPIYQADDGKTLLAILKNNEIDVVLLDLRMKKMHGDDAAKIILNRYGVIKIIALTMEDSPSSINKLMKIGIHAYLDKNCDPKELLKAIFSVYDYDFYRNGLMMKAMRSGLDYPPIATSVLLTKRELEILVLICEEFTNKEISGRLFISLKTVENHRYNLLQKLKVKNTVGLVRYAFSNKIIQLN